MKKEEYLILTDSHAKRGELDEFILNWQEAINICRKRVIRKILFAGDIVYNTSSQTLDVLLAIKQVLDLAKRNKIYVYCIYGNHDMPNREVESSYLHLFEGQKTFQVGSHLIFDATEDVSFKLQMVSYYLEGNNFLDIYDTVERNMSKTKKNILILHEGINGGLSANNDSNKELPAKMFDSFDLVLCGHYHNRVHIPGTDVYYIGSSRQMSFGEDEEKGYTILYNDGSIEFVKNKANKKFKTIEVNFKELNQNTEEDISEMVDEGYKVRLVIHCEKNEVNLVNKAAYLKAGASKVVIKADEASVQVKADQSAFTKYDKSGIIESYNSFCESKDIDPSFGEKYIKTIS